MCNYTLSGHRAPSPRPSHGGPTVQGEFAHMPTGAPSPGGEGGRGGPSCCYRGPRTPRGGWDSALPSSTQQRKKVWEKESGAPLRKHPVWWNRHRSCPQGPALIGGHRGLPPRNCCSDIRADVTSRPCHGEPVGDARRCPLDRECSCPEDLSDEEGIGPGPGSPQFPGETQLPRSGILVLMGETSSYTLGTSLFAPNFWFFVVWASVCPLHLRGTI